MRVLHLKTSKGFTIVELLIVVVVIAILAAITLVAFNGISQRAKQSAAASAAEQATKKILAYATTNADQYPPDLSTAGVISDANTYFEYSYDNSAKTYCVTATFQKVSYYSSNTQTSPTTGICSGQLGGPIADGITLQLITTANCPAARTRAVDARDKSTYWVQKLADGRCWMLTNLAYAGGTSNGGANTYGDVMPVGDGTAGTLNGPDNAGAMTYTNAKYYTPPYANPTTEPTNPSSSTDGGTTNTQYGYLYNWCAAMGPQNYATAACSGSSMTPAPDQSKSICPAGWRLPTSNGGEFTALNNAINSGNTGNDAGLRTAWLGQYPGYWNAGYQGGYGRYWSSTQSAGSTTSYMAVGGALVNPTSNTFVKNSGLTVRCIAV